MSLSDWIISLSGAALAIIMGIASYFAQKWIQSVDEKLKEFSTDFKAISAQINTVKQAQDSQTENISKAIISDMSNRSTMPFWKFDEITEEMKIVKTSLQKVLTQASLYSEHMGKVTVIEKQVSEQDKKIMKMFDILTIVAKLKK